MVLWRKASFRLIQQILSWPLKRLKGRSTLTFQTRLSLLRLLALSILAMIVVVAIWSCTVVIQMFSRGYLGYLGPTCINCPKYINTDLFTFVKNNEAICNLPNNNNDNGYDGSTIHQNFLISVIVSARHNFENREVIRGTWASLTSHKNWTLRHIFVLGVHSPFEETEKVVPDEDKRIDEEAEKYNDIVLANFYDSYHNLTLKHLIAYKWILNYCSNATVVLKTDDDMFINPYFLIDYLNEFPIQSNLTCHRYESEPRYYSTDKFRISREDYDGDTYPPYCIGAAFLTKPAIINSLFYFHRDIKYFWIEDIFVTGILREKYNNVTASTDNYYQNPSYADALNYLNNNNNRHLSLNGSMINIENIEDLFIIESDIIWSKNKIFYLIKINSSISFSEIMNNLWDLSVEFKNTKLQTVIISHDNINNNNGCGSIRYSINFLLLVLLLLLLFTQFTVTGSIIFC